MFIEGRNASRIDIANFFALPASLIDGSLSTASLTYSTQEGRRNEVYDYSIPYWCRPIEDRLSQDDVTPSGTSIKFDFSSLLTTVQAPVNTTED
jgi:phage portal protein BeeE